MTGRDPTERSSTESYLRSKGSPRRFSYFPVERRWKLCAYCRGRDPG